MDLEEIRFTADERRAGRATTLAVFFANASAPVPTSAIEERFYAELSEENRRKTFTRDRALLAEAGFHIREAGSRPVGRRGSEKLWVADEEANFSTGAELEPLEAIALDAACQPLLEEPGFMLAGALRRALAKIDRTFGDPEQAVQTNAPQVDATAMVMQACIEDELVADVAYCDASGKRSERRFAPLGTFTLRGHGYVVGDMVGEDEGTAVRRTLRLDRIENAVGTRQKYAAPADFNINDYRVLPFQIGDAQLEAVFLVPEDREADLRRASLGKGELRREDGRLTWRVDAASAEDAAAWAVAQGIRPLAPAELVDAWNRCLEGVLARGK